jgi:hypothetical protein
MKKSIPTNAQMAKMYEVRNSGYRLNEEKSLSAAGVIMEKGDDFWFFGLDGEILHNPVGYSIKTT